MTAFKYEEKIKEVIESWLQKKSLILSQESLRDLAGRVALLSTAGKLIEEDYLNRVIFSCFMMRSLSLHIEHTKSLAHDLYQMVFRDSNVLVEKEI